MLTSISRDSEGLRHKTSMDSTHRIDPVRNHLRNPFRGAW